MIKVRVVYLPGRMAGIFKLPAVPRVGEYFTPVEGMTYKVTIVEYTPNEKLWKVDIVLSRIDEAAQKRHDQRNIGEWV